MRKVPPPRVIRALSILATGLSSAAVIVLGLVALEVRGLIRDRNAILAGLDEAVRVHLAPLQANLDEGAQLLAVMAVAITVLAVSALAIPAFVGMLLREIAEQRRQQAALADSEARLRAITSHAPDAIIMTDGAGRVQFWNPGAQELFGYTAEEIRGKCLHELVAMPDDAARARAGMELFARTGTGPIVDRRRSVLARRKDGSTFQAQLSIAGVRQGDENWAVGLVRDVTAEHQAAEHLRELARTDSLTGLINRREFMALGAEEVARAQRYRRPMALLAIDLDHFKKINDTHGHAAGDAVLADFAHRLRSSLRSHDIAARIGGEEFIALLPETDQDHAMILARRLCEMMAAQPARYMGKPIAYTVSIGVAELAGAPGGNTAQTGSGPGHAAGDPAKLLLDCMARADAALYAAKQSGRNRACADDRRAGPATASAGR